MRGRSKVRFTWLPRSATGANAAYRIVSLMGRWATRPDLYAGFMQGCLVYDPPRSAIGGHPVEKTSDEGGIKRSKIETTQIYDNGSGSDGEPSNKQRESKDAEQSRAFGEAKPTSADNKGAATLPVDDGATQAYGEDGADEGAIQSHEAKNDDGEDADATQMCVEPSETEEDKGATQLCMLAIL